MQSSDALNEFIFSELLASACVDLVKDLVHYDTEFA